MKRHLILFAASLCMSAPLMAQDPAYSGYESNDDSRQFNFNPGNMMNRMTNPMRGMFGSSRRGYDDYDYPGPGYPPPGPGYGYPGYQAPYPGYAQPNQVPPAPAQSTPYSYPSAVPVPTQPAAAAPSQPPAYDRPLAAPQQYQPGFSQPDAASHYRFRPLGTEGQAEDERSSPPPDMTPAAPPPQPAAPTAAAPSAEQPTPLAPLSYPQPAPMGQPLAPISYPDTAAQTPASPPPVTQTPALQADPDLKFRPLDKPGYSSDLNQ